MLQPAHRILIVLPLLRSVQCRRHAWICLAFSERLRKQHVNALYSTIQKSKICCRCPNCKFVYRSERSAPPPNDVFTLTFTNIAGIMVCRPLCKLELLISNVYDSSLQSNDGVHFIHRCNGRGLARKSQIVSGMFRRSFQLILGAFIYF